MRRNLSIGIFHANWLLQIHTLNLAESLAAAGLSVHVFLYNANETVVDTDRHERLPLVTFHRINASGLAGNPFRSIRSKPTRKQLPRPYSSAKASDAKQYIEVNLRRSLKSFLIRAYTLATQKSRAHAWDDWLKSQLMDPVLTLLSAHRLDYVFGIEPYGFLWADAIGRHFGARSVYYSLEIENHKWNDVSPHLVPAFRRLRNNGIERCDAVIIQDNDRLATFREQTAWKGKKVFYIPVSLFGEACAKSTRSLHRKLNIPEHQKVILSFGWINRDRGVDQLMDAARFFDENWVLVLHSGVQLYDDVPLIEKASQEAFGNIRLSLKRLPEDELESMINSASVGLCFYSDRDENNRMTARSSEKMARYAKAGLPVVASNYSSYQSLFRQFPFGICVDSYKEIPNALRQIFASYEQYRINSLAAFRAIYSAEAHYKPLIDWILT